MDEKTLNEYHKHLRREYRKKQTIYNYYIYVKLFLQWYNKPAKDITEEDMLDWKEYIQEKYMVNGNLRRITSVNHFLKWVGKGEYKLPTPHPEDSNIIVLSDKEIDRYIQASENDPMDHMIALFQIDGLLRPGEFTKLKIKNMDLENQRFYLDDTKTGNNYIILSPRLIEAIKKYMIYRATPRPGYEDYLLIIPKGKYKGLVPNERAEFVRRKTKLLAVKAEITKRCTPYVVKPSVITRDFDRQINPKTIKRKARHKRIESTLRYDHTDDTNLIKHFELEHQKISDLSNKDKAQIMFDRFLAGELDIESFKLGLSFLLEKEHDKFKEGVGYV